MPDNLIFDFDSTFISLESLDEFILHKLLNNDKKSELRAKIEKVTNEGMEGNINFNTSINERLKLLNENKDSLNFFSKTLKKNISRSFLVNKDFIIENSHKILIISGGFTELIAPVVEDFKIKKDQIYANEFIFNKNGIIKTISKETLTYKHRTKAHLVKSLNLKGVTHIIGDGITDCDVWRKGYADEFYAFTENIERTVVVNSSKNVINCLNDYIKIIS
tara:strand:+ start:4742 stop:5401 length:660 start_codon:yes stop_codon:yes gene_type:complete